MRKCLATDGCRRQRLQAVEKKGAIWYVRIGIPCALDRRTAEDAESTLTRICYLVIFLKTKIR
jgi:hypothetical protein